MQKPLGQYSLADNVIPSARASARRARGGQMCRRTHLLRGLTCRSCLSEAASPRSEFCGTTLGSSTEVALRCAKGHGQQGRASFAYFDCASKKSKSLPGDSRPRNIALKLRLHSSMHSSQIGLPSAPTAHNQLTFLHHPRQRDEQCNTDQPTPSPSPHIPGAWRYTPNKAALGAHAQPVFGRAVQHMASQLAAMPRGITS